MRLIKLTEITGIDVSEVDNRYLNVDELGSLKKEKTDNYTMLITKHGRIFEFKETPEEIIELIKNAEEI